LSWRSKVQLLSLVTAVAAGAYARTAVSPLQESMKTALFLTDDQMALLQGPAMALPLLLTAVPLGLAIDRYSRVRLIIALTVLNIIASATTALVSSFALLFIARCVVGAVGFAMLPIALSLLSDLYPPDQRGRATTIVSVSQLGGASAAFALGGVLLSISGSGPEAWRKAMRWLTVPLTLVIASTCCMREPARTGQSIKNPSVSGAWRELWDYRRTIGPLMFGMAMLETGLGGALIWAAPMLSRRFTLAPDRVGVIMAMALLVSGAAGPILGGVVADMCQRSGGPGRITSVLSALAFLNVPAALFAVTPGVGLTAAVLVIFMTLIAASVVMATTLFTTIVPNELRGLCVSVSVAVNVLFAIGIAPPIVSALSGAIGGPAMIGKSLSLVCLCTSLLAAAAFSLGRRYVSRAVVQ
jgi:MFS family permease